MSDQSELEITIRSMKERLNALENAFIESVFNLTKRITELEAKVDRRRD